MEEEGSKELHGGEDLDGFALAGRVGRDEVSFEKKVGRNVETCPVAPG